MTQAPVSAQQRFRRYGESRPICGGHSGLKQGRGERCAGFFSNDREYAFCTREEYAGSLVSNENTDPPTFCHKLYGPCNRGKEHNPAHTSSNGHKPSRKDDDLFTYDDPRAVARFPFYDELGNLLYTTVRFEWPDKDNPKGHSKTYRQFRYENGQHQPGLTNKAGKQVRRVLYRLSDLRAEDPETTVYIPEGENKVEALRKLGLVATCCAEGAGKWRKGYSAEFKGRHAALLPDNDKAGKDHVQQIYNDLHGVAASVKIVQLPGLPDKGDVIDWLKAGGTKEELEHLSQPPKRKFLYASDVHPTPVKYLWEKRIAMGMLSLLIGDPGLGKGLLTATIAAEATRRGEGVIILSPEDSDEHTIVSRLIAAGADLRKIILLSEVPDFDSEEKEYKRPTSFPEDAGILEEAIVECKASLAIIDPVLGMVNGKYNSHKDQESRIAMRQVLTVAERQQCALLGIFHLNKQSNVNPLYRSGGLLHGRLWRVSVFSWSRTPIALSRGASW